MATQVGEGYIKITPHTEGFKEAVEGKLPAETEGAGEKAGSAFGGKFALKLVAALGALKVGEKIGEVIQQSLEAGGAMQQAIGGIETLYGESAETMKGYAKDAFMTAGLSATEYMETATSMSAALINSLGGDTATAAETANMAITDMSDNANKMGTSMESLQNAYTGFSRGNFTMLDNLSLGYAGTKEGMQQLLDAANELNAQQGKNTNYQIDNYADIVNAIHDVQTEMDITGTTAKEASTTYEGSLNSMKGAWQNLLATMTMGDDGIESMGTAMTDLATTASTFLFDNLIPMIGNIIVQLPAMIKTFIQQGVPLFLQNGMEMIRNIAQGIRESAPSAGEAFQNMLDNAITWLIEEFPTILQNGIDAVTNFVDGWGSGDGHMMETVGTTIGKILETIGLFLGQILLAGAQIIMQLIIGFVQNIPYFLQQIGTMIGSMIQTFIDNHTAFEGEGGNVIANLLLGLGNAALGLLTAIGTLILDMFTPFDNADWSSIGSNIISGIINGITFAAQTLWTTLTNLAESALESVKTALGIASPSKEFAKISEWIPEGMAVGIEANANSVTDAMNDITRSTLGAGVDLATNISTSVGSNIDTSASDQGSIIAGLYDLLAIYLPQCAEGLNVDGDRLAEKLDSRLASNNMRRVSAW